MPPSLHETTGHQPCEPGENLSVRKRSRVAWLSQRATTSSVTEHVGSSRNVTQNFKGIRHLACCAAAYLLVFPGRDARGLCHRKSALQRISFETLLMERCGWVPPKRIIVPCVCKTNSQPQHEMQLECFVFVVLRLSEAKQSRPCSQPFWQGQSLAGLRIQNYLVQAHRAGASKRN